MKATYNQIAGQSVERIAALSDGIFAVAMTLLVLDLKVPVAESIHTERDLRGALLALAPRLLMFAMSFFPWESSGSDNKRSSTIWNVPTEAPLGFTSPSSA